MKTVLQLDHIDARNYFLNGKNYQNFDLPDYYVFDDILSKVSKEMGRQPISYFIFNKKVKPNDLEGVNHKIVGNKDGELAWRPFELIHPVLYVGLVHLITDEENWAFICNAFDRFHNPRIICASIPSVSISKKSDKAEQIIAWWEQAEQDAITLGLDYKYVFDADISDCYGSIYTHSVVWALHGKEESKEAKKESYLNKLLGAKIDTILQMMHYGQTNGIPQGSSISDLISEIVLGYADTILTERISDIPTLDYKIVRYRDDYRVFTNKPDQGRRIMKELTEALSDLGLKLNTSKTKESGDPILASIKEDKIDELFIPMKRNNYSKWIIQIYATLAKHPNTGKAARQLNTYHSTLFKHKSNGEKLRKFEKPEPMLSVIVNMAIKNPKYYNLCMAIMSLLIDYCAPSKRLTLINKVKKKFDAIPNTGILDIWLQRVAYKVNPNINYREKLTHLLQSSSTYPGNTFWNCNWLKPTMQDIVIDTPIINEKRLADIGIVIDRTEVNAFRDIIS